MPMGDTSCDCPSLWKPQMTSSAVYRLWGPVDCALPGGKGLMRGAYIASADSKPLPMHLQAARDSARLGIAETDIIDAIKRGWFAERLELIEPVSIALDTMFGDSPLQWHARAA